LRSTCLIIAVAIDLIAAIPNPEYEIEEKILTLAVGDTARHSLSRWVDLCLRTHGLETEVCGICPPQALDTNSDVVAPLIEKAKACGVADLSIEQLPRVYDEARESAERIGHLTQLIAELLRVAGRHSNNLGFDEKSEAMAVGYLHAVHKISPENLRYRSLALTDESAVEELRAAESVANEVQSAAADARFSDPVTSSFAETIPSVQELRQAAGILRETGFFGKLLGREWRAARAVCRCIFPEEPRLAPHDAAKRLMAAAQWKDRVQRLEACAEAKKAAGRHWNGASTPFDKLISVAEWMRSIQKVTPLTEHGARELRRLAYESSADDFGVLARFAETAEGLNLVNAFRSARSAQSTIYAEAERQGGE
jgi:hypothetical protein